MATHDVVHFRQHFRKHVLTNAAFSFDVVIDPLKGRPMADGIFAIELIMEQFVPGSNTDSGWSIWRVLGWKRTGGTPALRIDASSKRGPTLAATTPGGGHYLDMSGTANPAGRVVFSTPDGTNTLRITVDPTVVPTITIGVSPDDFIDFAFWLEIKATRQRT